jgi:hypothetical protein
MASNSHFNFFALKQEKIESPDEDPGIRLGGCESLWSKV